MIKIDHDNSPLPVALHTTPIDPSGLSTAESAGMPLAAGAAAQAPVAIVTDAITSVRLGHDNSPLPVPTGTTPAPPQSPEPDEQPDVEEPLPTSIRVPFSGTVILAAAAAIALVFLLLLSQVSSLVLAVQTAPAWFRYIGYAGILVLIAIILAFLGRAIVAIWRLGANPRIRLRDLEAVSEPQRRRQRISQSHRAAKEILLDYLRKYPIQERDRRRKLKQLGLRDDHIDNLRQAHRWLTGEEGDEVTSDSWLLRFREDWQGALERHAMDGICRRYARNTALATGISPNSAFDTIIVAVNAVQMIADLCVLFDLRIHRTSVWILTAYLCVQAYVARHGQQVGETVGDAVSNQLQNISSEEGWNAVMTVAGKVVGKTTGLAVEAGVNYLLMKRLGRTTVNYLKPLAT